MKQGNNMVKLSPAQYQKFKNEFSELGGISPDMVERNPGVTKGLSGKAFSRTLVDPRVGVKDKEIEDEFAGMGISLDGLDKQLVNRLYERGMTDKIKELAGFAGNATLEANKNVPTKLAEGVDKTIQGVAESKLYRGTTYVPKKLSGLGAGAMGGVGGFAVGGVGQPIVNAIKGEPLTKDVFKKAVEYSKKVAEFGYSIGDGGVDVAVLGALGEVPIAVMGAAQIYTGAQEVVKAAETGDQEALTSAIAKWTAGSMMFAGGSKGVKDSVAAREPISTTVRPEAVQVAKDLPGAIKGKLSAAKDRVFKSPEAKREKIIRTPEEKVYKLNEKERQIYYNQKARESNEATAVRNREAKARLDETRDIYDSLSKEKKVEFKAELDKAKSEYKSVSEGQKNKFQVELDKATQEFNALSKERQAELQSQVGVDQKSFSAKTEAIKTESAKKLETLKEENTALSNELSKATIEEAQSLKPKLLESMQKNSKTYRDLVAKEIDPVKNNPVKNQELIDFVENKYAESPKEAADVLGILKLKPEETSTIGEIHTNTKAARQKVSKTSRTGKSTFSSKDVQINKAVSTLSDFIKSKGVNLSEANKFWSEYAPLRDKAFKNIQPFTPKGSESGTFDTFTKNIEKAVEGNNPKGENFVEALESLLGEKIGNKEVRDAFGKLKENEKAAIAEKLTTDKTLKKLSEEADAKKQELSDVKAQEKENMKAEFGEKKKSLSDSLQKEVDSLTAKLEAKESNLTSSNSKEVESLTAELNTKKQALEKSISQESQRNAETKTSLEIKKELDIIKARKRTWIKRGVSTAIGLSVSVVGYSLIRKWTGFGN